MEKKSVAVLGATGTVGQKFLALLQEHPRFEVAELVASPRREGEKYGEAVHWRESTPLPKKYAGMKLIQADQITSPYVVSSIPGKEAESLEIELTSRGHHVLSNASAHRMQPDVPLLIPEINSSHLALVEKQKQPGKLITNPNCSTVFLTLGLAALREIAPIQSVSVVTLQAVSGAGYPGVPSIDLIANTIPNIPNEEEKIETEAQKILGEMDQAAEFPIMAHVNRIPVAHGHTVLMQLQFQDSFDERKVEESITQQIDRFPKAYTFHRDPMRPQIRLDLKDNDMRAHLGRLKISIKDRRVGLLSMGHNLVRGAAGAAIANLEKLDEYLNR